MKSLARMATKISPLKSAHPFRKTGLEGGEEQVRAISHDQLSDVDQAENSLAQKNIVLIDIEFVDDDPAQPRIDVGIDRQADHRATATGLEGCFKGLAPDPRPVRQSP